MEDFLDFIQAHAWVRALVFGVLLAVFWGNWTMMGGIVAIWALHEVIVRIRRGK